MRSRADVPAKRETALITGASMGLGAELARLFAADGYDLVLVARSEDKLVALKKELEGLRGVSARVIAADLTERLAPEVIHQEIEEAGLTVDVLVNNAGFGHYSFFHQSDLQTVLDMIQVNVTALVHLTRLFIADMVARRSGRVMNVASTAAFQPGPLQPVYYATKAFVLSFSEAIANELAGTGVSVTTFCPGPTQTEFHARAGTTRARGFKGAMMMDAETAARVGYEGMKKGKRVVIPGVLNRALAFATRLAPRSAAMAIVRSMQSPAER